MEAGQLELMTRVLGGRRAPLRVPGDDAGERTVGVDAVEREHLFDVVGVAARPVAMDALEHRVHEVAEIR